MIDFRISSHCTYGNCVEVAALHGQVATRDSKNPAGPALLFTAEAWTAFLTGVTAGEFGQA